MSDDSEKSPAEVPATKAARKKPAARKAAKQAKTKAAPVAEVEASPQPVAAPAEETGRREPAARRESAKPAPAEQESGTDGAASEPEPIPFFTDSPAGDPPGNNKKRRRRKKKRTGDAQQGPHPQAVAHSNDGHRDEHEGGHAPAMQAAPRTKLDAEEVEKKAWKMFQAEVGEEGLALIDDHDAREISRRCFRLAEIFLDEAARRNR